MDRIKAMKMIATMPLALGVALLLFFGIGESAGGDLSGLAHLIPAILMGLLIWLAWKQPRWGGIAAIVLGLLSAVRFSRAILGGNLFGPLLIYVGPLLIGGILLLIADRLQRAPA